MDENSKSDQKNLDLQQFLDVKVSSGLIYRVSHFLTHKRKVDFYVFQIAHNKRSMIGITTEVQFARSW